MTPRTTQLALAYSDAVHGDMERIRKAAGIPKKGFYGRRK